MSEQTQTQTTLSEDQQKLVEAGQRVRTTDDDSAKSAHTRPEWVPEKFFDAATGQVNYEALAKSYKELEGKLGSQQAPATEAPQSTPATPEQTPEASGNAIQSAYAEFAQAGKLSDATYKALEETHKLGKAEVDAYIAGQMAIQRDSELGVQQVIASVGGQETFAKLTEWAKVNLKPEQLKAYNDQVSMSVESAGIAVQWLKAQYEATVGKDPVLVTGRPSTGESDGFANRSEMMAAMRDPRYGRDRDYDKEVARKMANRRFTL